MQDHILSEQQLLQQFRQQETKESAFTTLMQTYQQRLYWHIRKMVTFHEDADDVLQQTFIKAWKGLHNFRGEAKLSTWLYRIATNEALAHIRKAKQKMVNTTVSITPDTIGERLAADPYFDGEQIDILLQEAIHTLPDKQRAVFTMRYFDALKYEDIAAILDTSIGGLKANYHHAARKVADYVKTRLNQPI